jgi:hypothetical protein
MVVAVFLVTAPVVAIIAFPDVARTVLGVLAVLAAFQVLARIGGWRWAAWDARERMSARTGQAYPGIRHILVQAGLLVSTMTVLFLAVVVDSVPALGIALAGLVFAVLLGIAIDVLASGREDQATPADSLLRQMKTSQRA